MFTYEVFDFQVVFNATPSYDPDGFIVSYTWDFGDGNISTTSDPVITHTYSAPGLYKVVLTVTDNEGMTSSKAENILIRLRGDLDGSGDINVTDVNYLAYMIVGKAPSDLTADFNGNKRVDIGDLAKIAYYVMGLINQL